MALCCREAWGEAWKGVKLPRLYILLREQLAYQDDPWCVETIKWWNGFVVLTISSSHVLTVLQEGVQRLRGDWNRSLGNIAGCRGSINA